MYNRHAGTQMNSSHREPKIPSLLQTGATLSSAALCQSHSSANKPRAEALSFLEINSASVSEQVQPGWPGKTTVFDMLCFSHFYAGSF